MISKEQTVGSVVALNHRTAPVFTQNGIDFCCRGGTTIEEACRKRGLVADALVESLEAAMAIAPEWNPAQASAHDLVNRIVLHHHDYIRHNAPQLSAYFQKLCSVHGANHPELFWIRDTLADSFRELDHHMMREEKVLFPYLIELETALNQGKDMVPYGSLEGPLRQMELEHQNEGDRFAEIALRTHGYIPPEDGCATYRAAFALLADFERDLHLHIHLENHVLFPKGRMLEARAHQLLTEL